MEKRSADLAAEVAAQTAAMEAAAAAKAAAEAAAPAAEAAPAAAGAPKVEVRPMVIFLIHGPCLGGYGLTMCPTLGRYVCTHAGVGIMRFAKCANAVITPMVAERLRQLLLQHVARGVIESC